MQPISHQVMGYDRTITMFSPDGRLLQVEYAKKMVRQGTTVVGMIYKEGVLLVADKRILDKLMVPESVEKIFKVDEHVAASASGLVSDGRTLIERSQVKAQQNRITYGSPIDVITIIKDICDLKQMYTQSGGVRPFGVSILFGGVNETGPVLYLTEPSGVYFRFKAAAIGEMEVEINELLNKMYKENLSLDGALKLSVKVMTEVLDKDFNINRLEGVYIDSQEKKFTKVKKETLKHILSTLRK